MTLLLTQASLERDPHLLGEALRVITQDAEFLRASYPQFDKWFACKVLPGLFAGERTVLIEERESTVVGLMILKHTDAERKLCTLRVRPHFESRGLGIRLFQIAFEILKTERPLLSVSETSMPKFKRLFKHFGFAQEAVYEERYLPKVDEFAFNGLLDAPKPKFVLDTCTCLLEHSLHPVTETVTAYGSYQSHVWKQHNLIFDSLQSRVAIKRHIADSH